MYNISNIKHRQVIFAGDAFIATEGVKLSGSERKRLQIDRALEKLIKLRAEGESTLKCESLRQKDKDISDYHSNITSVQTTLSFMGGF